MMDPEYFRTLSSIYFGENKFIFIDWVKTVPYLFDYKMEFSYLYNDCK